jgi:hypothetical protein
MFFAGSILRRATGCEGAMPAGSSVVCRGKRRSLRGIAGSLAQAGFLTKTGKPYTAEAVSRMVRAKG